MVMRISLRYELYRGLHSRIAKRLGMSRSYVWRVANGERASAKVEAALKQELGRLQRADKSPAGGKVIVPVAREARRKPTAQGRARSNSQN